MTFRELPLGAQVHVALVIGAGSVAFAWSMTMGVFEHPWILVTLVLASVAAATLKSDLPLSSYSTLSIGYTVNFASLLQFGPAMTIWVAASGGWAQCTLNTKQRNPWYRTAFSMSTLTLATFAASATLTLAGGQSLTAPADVVVPALAAAALVYFLVNAALMALAIGLSMQRAPLDVLDREFIWGLPNYFIGALVATVGVAGLQRFGLRAAVLLVVPLLLTYRLYKVYLARVEEISRTNQELHVKVERAQAESVTDPLTGLPNRRFLADHTVQEIARAERQQESFAFIMIDLDQFKAINDTFGHQSGDEALITVAACLKSALRSYDVCCRYAGDEFALVLSNCPCDLAHLRADAIAAEIASLRFEGAPGFAFPLAASAGVAVFPDDGRTYHELLAAADARMYRRKGAARAAARV